METPARLLKYIATRDKRVAKYSWNKTAISQLWSTLLEFRHITVGGRVSCGPKVDASWVEFTAWNEVVNKAVQIGFNITVEPVKHGNAWATKSGGFWQENRYSLVS